MKLQRRFDEMGRFLRGVARVVSPPGSNGDAQHEASGQPTVRPATTASQATRPSTVASASTAGWSSLSSRRGSHDTTSTGAAPTSSLTRTLSRMSVMTSQATLTDIRERRTHEFLSKLPDNRRGNLVTHTFPIPASVHELKKMTLNEWLAALWDVLEELHAYAAHQRLHIHIVRTVFKPLVAAINHLNLCSVVLPAAIASVLVRVRYIAPARWSVAPCFPFTWLTNSVGVCIVFIFLCFYFSCWCLILPLGGCVFCSEPLLSRSAFGLWCAEASAEEVTATSAAHRTQAPAAALPEASSARCCDACQLLRSTCTVPSVDQGQCQLLHWSFCVPISTW